MCTAQLLTDPFGIFTKPKIQAPKLPPPPQAAKAPDTSPLRKRNVDQGGPAVSDSTLLTGTSGIPTASLNLGGSTLLGG